MSTTFSLQELLLAQMEDSTAGMQGICLLYCSLRELMMESVVRTSVLWSLLLRYVSFVFHIAVKQIETFAALVQIAVTEVMSMMGRLSALTHVGRLGRLLGTN